MQILRSLSPDPHSGSARNSESRGWGVHSYEVCRQHRAMQRRAAATGLGGDVDCLHGSQVRIVFIKKCKFDHQPNIHSFCILQKIALALAQ